MSDLLFYGALGIGIAALVVAAVLRPAWLKPALLGIGLLFSTGVVRLILVRQRRFRKLGATAATAGALARLTMRAEQLREKSNAAVDAAERDRELRRVETEILVALQNAQKDGADVEAIREEVHRAFPGL